MQQIFARYDLRTKQKYIFRTNAVREIAGASALITAVYDDFLNSVELTLGEKIRKDYIFEDIRYINAETPFTFDPGNDCGQVFYVGGGNLYMLWRDRDTALRANGILCEMLREKCYGLSAVCGMTEYTGRYDEDHEALNENYDRAKLFVPAFMPSAVLPFTELDRRTSLPIAYKDRRHGSPVSLSAESRLKQEKYDRIADSFGESEKEFDRMITKKGTESLLAVIHIDGNNMGSRVAACMRPNGGPIDDYAEAARAMRVFSNEIQRCFVTEPLEAIREHLGTKPMRVIIAGGDDLTIVCNARDALDIVRVYFEKLRAGSAQNTACAGICVFHSHAPFSTAYEIAEECCESAKKVNRKNGGANMLVDFQHSFGGAVGTLESMREADRKDLIRRPYILDSKPGIFTIADFTDAMRVLSGFGRSNIKNLSYLQMTDHAAYEFELARLRAQFPAAKVKEEHLKLLHDVAQFYDIWHAKEEG